MGGGAPVVVQSMTLTETHDVEATLAQIRRLADAGCELARVAVPGRLDADALPAIVAGSPLPVIADIHFNASLALRAIDAGVAAVRINPGNIGGPDKVEQVVSSAKAAGIAMRIGANSARCPITCASSPPTTPPARWSRPRSRRCGCWNGWTTASSRSRSRAHPCP